jgi:hypothetical protein
VTNNAQNKKKRIFTNQLEGKKWFLALPYSLAIHHCRLSITSLLPNQQEALEELTKYLYF